MSKHSTGHFRNSPHNCGQMQYELIKDIDFDSSFSDSAPSDSMDDSDLFDPADLEGLVMPSTVRENAISHTNLPCSDGKSVNPNDEQPHALKIPPIAPTISSTSSTLRGNTPDTNNIHSVDVSNAKIVNNENTSTHAFGNNIPPIAPTISSTSSTLRGNITSHTGHLPCVNGKGVSPNDAPVETSTHASRNDTPPTVSYQNLPSNYKLPENILSLPLTALSHTENSQVPSRRPDASPQKPPSQRNNSQAPLKSPSQTLHKVSPTHEPLKLPSQAPKLSPKVSPSSSPTKSQSGNRKSPSTKRTASQNDSHISPRISKIHEYLGNTQFANETPSRSTESIFDKLTSTFKRPKSDSVAQIRNLSTSTKRPKNEDLYHTIQLATQKGFPTSEHEHSTNPPTSTKDLKNVKPIILSSEQEYVLQMALRGKSIFFTGSAGTGKSVLLRSIIKSLKTKHNIDQVAVTASTGLAACNIGGVTLHSFAGIGLGQGSIDELLKKVKKNKKAIKKWVTTKVLVIDEISMIDGRLLDKLNAIAKKLRYSTKPFGGIQIIACGDFYQLPPVSKNITLEDGQEVEDEALFAFESSAWNNAIKSSIILKEVFRQKGDQVFIDMLNSMRTGIVSPSTEAEFRRLSRPLDCPAGIVPTQLYATRNEVDDANKLKLSQIPGSSLCYNSIDGGSLPPEIRQISLNNFLAPQRLFLKKGAQVMCIKNFDDTLVNGSLGQVIDFLDRDTYMCQGYFQEYPNLSVEEIKNKLQERKSEEGKDGENQAVSRLDSVFEFLNKFETKAADFVSQQEQSQEEAFLQNSQRKRELLEKLQEVSGGEKFPLVRFLLPDGVNTRDVLVEPEQWTIEDEKTKRVLASRTQLPLMLAWALSIHKAQGQTLAKAKVDLSRVFENGQAYVALSRAVSREGLQVLNFRKEKVTTHFKVQDFYKSLMSTEDLASISYEDESRPLLQMSTENQAKKAHA